MDLTPAFDLIVMSLRSAMVFTKCFIIHFKGFKTVIIEVISSISKSQSFFILLSMLTFCRCTEYIKETEFYFSYINNSIDQFALAFIFFSFRLLNASVGLYLLWWTLSTPPPPPHPQCKLCSPYHVNIQYNFVDIRGKYFKM